MERNSGHKIINSKEFPLAQVERAVEIGVAPGCSVSVIANGNMESTSFGFYGDSKTKEVTPNTIYDLASITKLFTTALVLRQHETGSLSIDDLCAEYLENFAESQLTLKDLLTHRVDFGIRLSEYRAKHPNREDLMRSLLKITPPLRHSDTVHYANLGFIYLGTILEQTTNKELNNQMHELFQDLGLHETYTGVEIQSQQIETPPTEVVGKSVVQRTTHDETARILGGISGNAGVFSSSEDLARFGRAWVQGEIVKPGTLRKETFTNHDQSGLKPQALGWWMRTPGMNGEISTPNMYSHSGYTGSFLAISIKNDKVCAFTCNRTYYGRDNSKQKGIWEPIMRWVQS